MPSRIKVGDHVVVIAGKDKGKQGRVLKLDRAKDRVMVEGCGIVTKHRRNNPQQPQNSGRVQTEGMIHMSNVMPWSDKDGKGVRVKTVVAKDGKRDRASVASGAGTSSAMKPTWRSPLAL